jgi:long-chain acyl-CoA synthetase
VAGGGPLNLATADYFDDLGWYIVQGYGMSENGPLITTNTMKYKNNRSAGLVVKNTELRIDEPNADGIGEILVRSPSMMKGYFNNPEATADCFTSDGWLRTGDLGYRDSDGYLFISGRRKNLIVTRGGKNIYPEEIEALFAHSRVIKEIMVVGRKSAQNDSSEEVVAVCVPDLETPVEGGTETALSELRIRELIKTEIASANRMLPAYKKIVDFVVRTEEFEKTSSRKVKRYLYAHYTEPREPSK